VSDLAAALIETLDDHALDALAERLAPHLAERLASERADDGEDRWMTTAEAAGYVGMSTNALHKLTSARQVPFDQRAAGCRCYFRRSELDAWRQNGRPGRR
jgi:hypothetical protein